MTSLYSFVAIYVRALETADHILGKGLAFASEKGISGQEMLGWQLVEDMNPLSFQLAVIINFSNGWVARAAGVAVPESVEGAALDVAGFKAAIADARAFLGGITPDQINDREDTPITFKLGDIMEPTLPASQWLTGFATTNIHFHLSMAYAILRLKGVPIGKIDLFPSGL
ncbi:MAG: DUF1993 domain-containing protein [Pseudomonadota bacterium]